MKKNTAALYDPYLDVFGGGERHVLAILNVLSDCGFKPTVFWDSDVTDQITNKLNLRFSQRIDFQPNIFKQKVSLTHKLKMLSKYDTFIYVTDGSYFFSSAGKTYIFCMVPDKKLYSRSLMNRVKTLGAIFIANSMFTQRQLQRLGISSHLLYPYLEDDFITADIAGLNKQKYILSVGRFFKHLHAKRQDKMIEYFQRLKKNSLQYRSYKLILAGGLKAEDNQYFKDLKALIGNDASIELRPNVSYKELLKLYKESQIYWHFAGYGVDEDVHPERTEHLGITPLEAMAMGCITVCYRAGGLKEIIKENQTGYLFHSYEELKSIMEGIQTQNNASLQKKAKEFISENFNYHIFSQHVKQIFL